MSLDTGRRSAGREARRSRPANPVQPDRDGLAVPPGRSQPQGRETPLPLVVAGALGGAGAAGLALAVLGFLTLTAWMLDPGADLAWSAMLEAAVGAFLLGQGVPLAVAGVTLSLPPIGIGLLCLAFLVLAARWAAGASAVGRRGEAVVVAAGMAAGYGFVAAISAALSHDLGVSPLIAFLACAGIAFATSCIAILRAHHLVASDRLPADLRDAVAGATVAALLIAAGGAVLVLTAILTHLADVGLLLGSLNLGLSGALLVTALSIAYLPVFVVWGGAYLLGPGFAIAGGSVIGPLSDASATTVPGLPLLAALPSDAPPFGIALPAIAVGCGAIAGLLLRRRGHHGVQGLAVALLAALIAGAMWAIACWICSGALGVVLLASVGPSPITVGLAAIATVAVGAGIVMPWRPKNAGASGE